MSFVHVEDTDPVAKPFTGGPRAPSKHSFGYSSDTTRHVSSTTVGHTVWRCWNCKALAVGERGCAAPAKCSKCGTR